MFRTACSSSRSSLIIVLMAAIVIGGVSIACTPPPPDQAKNVVLFVGDGTGLPSLHAASVRATGDSQGLYLHQMPHLALSDTSAASRWVSDSAAGMTAIVTGEKTNNGVVSQSSDAERGIKDGEILKTILEYAEERGLSTGARQPACRKRNSVRLPCRAGGQRRSSWLLRVARKPSRAVRGRNRRRQF